MQQTSITKSNIETLVRVFYGRVRTDPELSPIFNTAIGETDAQWEEHLAVLIQFWSSVMLSTGEYHGSPIQKHIALPSFPAQRFDRWLELFEISANEIFTKTQAEDFLEKAQRIAKSFKLMLYPEDTAFKVKSGLYHRVE